MAASMDMGAGFAATTLQASPQAKIDRFHVSNHLNEAVDKVRRDEHRSLLEKGDDPKLIGVVGASAGAM